MTGTATPPATFDLEAIAARLDEAHGRMTELDPLPRQVLRDHIAAIDDLHAEALRTIVRHLRDDEHGKELLFEMAELPIVRMVLSMHGIIRSEDPMAAAERVLDEIRPGITTHGGDVQLAYIEDAVAYVRLSGACNGCSMASVTMRNGVEKALLEAVPALTAVEVLPNEPEPAPLLQIEVVGAGRSEAPRPADAGWYETFPVERIPPGKLEALSLRPDDSEAVEVIVVNAAGKMAAYVNACAHQGMPLDNALVDAEEGTITCPWHGFCFDSTNGECLTAPGAQLEQLPLRIENGHVWVRATA